MNGPPLSPHTHASSAEADAADPVCRGRLAPVLMVATFSLLGAGCFLTIAGGILLGLMGRPPDLAVLTGEIVFGISAIVAVVTMGYSMSHG